MNPYDPYGICDYCYRPAICIITLRQSWWRLLLHLPRERRQVCGRHIRHGVYTAGTGWRRL